MKPSGIAANQVQHSYVAFVPAGAESSLETKQTKFDVPDEVLVVVVDHQFEIRKVCSNKIPLRARAKRERLKSRGGTLLQSRTQEIAHKIALVGAYEQ